MCRAANDCPWLNEATAGGLLGGEAVGSYTAEAAGQPAVCTFTQKDANATRTLRITVEQKADAHMQVATLEHSCGPDATPMQAIGNEAMTCTADDRKGGPGARAVGRVRDQVFTITISSTLKGDPSLTREVLKSRIYTAAEQVSGNLF
jgi:hypothetical protein